MVKKSKLLLALDVHRGRDYGKDRQKKLTKAAEKRKKAKRTAENGDGYDREAVCHLGTLRPELFHCIYLLAFSELPLCFYLSFPTSFWPHSDGLNLLT
jgi:hypothetical protein